MDPECSKIKLMYNTPCTVKHVHCICTYILNKENHVAYIDAIIEGIFFGGGGYKIIIRKKNPG